MMNDIRILQYTQTDYRQFEILASSLLLVEMVLDPDVTMRQGSYPMRGPLPLSTGEESERETARPTNV